MTRTVAAIDKEIAETKEALAGVRGKETEVYARIVGYYRSVRNWNKGKRDEFNHRKLFSAAGAKQNETLVMPKTNTISGTPLLAGNVARYDFFARKTCPNCPPVKAFLKSCDLQGATIDVDSRDGFEKAVALGVSSAPTVILYDDRGNLAGEAHNVAELSALLETGVEERIAV
jgi:ribonucleoside-triphosphate reductase